MILDSRISENYLSFSDIEVWWPQWKMGIMSCLAFTFTRGLSLCDYLVPDGFSS